MPVNAAGSSGEEALPLAPEAEGGSSRSTAVTTSLGDISRSPVMVDPLPEREGQLSDPASGGEPVVLREPVDEKPEALSNGVRAPEVVVAANGDASAATVQPVPDDLGDVFGRVRALSLTLNHPAFQRALAGFADGGRVYLAYPDENLPPLARRPGGLAMAEADALNVAIQVCQAVAFVNRRGLRVNDICPESVAFGADGRIRLTGLDYISNDNELQAEPIFNDGYTAPEIYRARKVDKRADVFSVGALLYSCLTGKRLDAETWREEAGPIRFYPPHVVTPAIEQAVRRALLFDPAARWASVDALKAELVRLGATIRLRAAALSDVGMVRELNEDAVMAVAYSRDSQVEPAQNFLYVVADGMGGAEAGEIASAIAVGAIRNYIGSALEAAPAAGDIRGLLQDALEEANKKILEYAAAHAEARGMGSTAVGALIIPPEAAVAWVGDSRAYLCDHNGLRQVTKDHSLVQRLIEIGQITPEEARHHEHKNVITRSLGARPSGPAGAESVTLRLKRGDRLMLCSDGLTTHVEDEKIGEILRRHADPCAAARELVVAANAGGGTDNVSVVVICAG
jgi:protein phosphatase